MKKITITILVALICISTASANYIDDFLGITYEVSAVAVDEIVETQICPDEYLFRNELSQLNKLPEALDFLDVFDDGYHVIELKQGTYLDETQFTIKKNNGKIIWIKKGICATNYDLYSLNFNLSDLEQKIRDGTFNPVTDGYNTLNNIEGLRFTQKLQILHKAMKYGFSKGGN